MNQAAQLLTVIGAELICSNVVTMTPWWIPILGSVLLLVAATLYLTA